MKKFISLALSTIMLSSSVAMAAYTAPTTKSGILTELGVPAGMHATFNTDVNHDVDADIKIKKNGATSYVDGPINILRNNGAGYPKFDFIAEFDMSSVRELLELYISKGKTLLDGDPTPTQAEVEAGLGAVQASGQFIITIKYPKQLELPASFVNGTGLYGFTGANDAFTETSRSESTVGNEKTLTIIVDVKPGITCGELRTALPDLTLECVGTQTTADRQYKVSGAVTGQVKIGDTTDPISTINFNAVQDGTSSNATLNAIANVSKRTGEQDGSNIGGNITIMPGGTVVPPADTSVSVVFSINGDNSHVNAIENPTGSVSVDVDNIKAPEREYLTFAGWYSDPQFTNELSGVTEFKKDTVVYGKYVITQAPDVFETDDHHVYINGYPDGTVQPHGNITREEVATALYRLLKEEVQKSITTENNSFADVAADRWSNVYVSSMANGGYIKGYEDGTFRPGNYITRAEFAALVIRFFNEIDSENVGTRLTDIFGHWAEDSILAANHLFIVNGYEDNSFRPDAYITRAEAMAIINRITVRRPTEHSFAGEYKEWPDSQKADWFYEDVIEATNGHDFERLDEIMTEGWTVE